MAASKVTDFPVPVADHFDNTIHDTELDQWKSEADLRLLDQELDQRISQVLRLTQVAPRPLTNTPPLRPSVVSNVKTIPKTALQRPGQKKSNPQHTYRSGRVINISNGNIEVENRTVSRNKAWRIDEDNIRLSGDIEMNQNAHSEREREVKNNWDRHIEQPENLYEIAASDVIQRKGFGNGDGEVNQKVIGERGRIYKGSFTGQGKGPNNLYDMTVDNQSERNFNEDGYGEILNTRNRTEINTDINDHWSEGKISSPIENDRYALVNEGIKFTSKNGLGKVENKETYRLMNIETEPTNNIGGPANARTDEKYNLMITEGKLTNNTEKPSNGEKYQLVNEESEATRNKEHLGNGEKYQLVNKEREPTSNNEYVGNVEKESDEEEEEQDALFDEFLDAHTRGKLILLTTKVTTLTQALQAAKDEYVRQSNSRRDAVKAAQAGEAERRILGKRVTTLQQDATRLTRSNSHLNTRVKELTTECQGLRKELCNVRQREGEQRGGHSTLQAQLTRTRDEAATLRQQMAAMTTRHKAEMCELRGRLEECEVKGRGLERTKRNLAALTAKQQRLIQVLHKQKSNIAAGKAVTALEEKFMATIAPLHNPSSSPAS